MNRSTHTTRKTPTNSALQLFPLSVVFILWFLVFDGWAQNVSPQDTGYRTVKAFWGKVRLKIPEEATLQKDRHIRDPAGFDIRKKVGYRDSTRFSIKLFVTRKPYDDDPNGIKIWTVLRDLSTRYRKSKWLKSGLVEIDDDKTRNSETLYYVRLRYVDSAGKSRFALLMAADLENDLLVGLVDTSHRESIRSYEKVCHTSLDLDQ